MILIIFCVIDHPWSGRDQRILESHRKPNQKDVQCDRQGLHANQRHWQGLLRQSSAGPEEGHRQAICVKDLEERGNH